MRGLPYFFDGPQNKSNIHHHIPANGLVESIVGHGSLPDAVKIDADQTTLRIQRWRSAVAAGGVVAGNKTHG